MIKSSKKILFGFMAIVMFYGLVELILYLAGFSFQPMTHCGTFGEHFEAIDSHYIRDARRFWLPIPSAIINTEWTGSTDAHISSLSTRGSEPIVPKPSDYYRILCLGDSGTFGFGVSDNDTWPSHLERMLNDAHTEFYHGKHVDVINAGVNGFSTWQAVEHYKELESTLDPDLIILSTGRNDIVALQMADSDRPVISPIMLKIAERVQYSRLGQLILYLNQRDTIEQLESIPEKNEDRVLRVGETQFKELITFMIEDNRKKQRPFLFLARGGHWYSLRAYDQHEHFTLVDFYPLDQLGQIKMFMEGGHPDSNALKLVAEYVAEVLRETPSQAQVSE